ncbi:MAG: DUF5071 domain-containing protein [Bacillota bacterium]|nr:DUF5071 domain-containing protein [Bacillota bacterium]
MDNNLLLSLSWNQSLDIQENAICEIASMNLLNPKDLLQPSRKEYWENAAKVLIKMGYPRIKESISGLLIWLQDMNWPGSNVVIEILRSLPKAVFIPHLECAVLEAMNTNDDIWLSNLSIILTQCNLKEIDFISKDVYLTLLDIKEV